MPYINTEVFDGGLDYATTNGSRVDICYTQEPTTYTEATSTYTCGNETAMTVPVPEAGAVDGRRVIIPAITDGDVTATQTADWWGLTDASAVLIAAGDLSAPQAVTNTNKFTLDAISVTIRAAA